MADAITPPLVANGSPAKEHDPNEDINRAPKDIASKVQRPQRPRYNLIHARPLPLAVHPLPAFIPHNPLSILRIAYVLLSQWFFPPSSHSGRYQGYFSPETRSVHITNPQTIRALWEQGFFGKGTLSRSEPTWLEGEKRRRGLLASETSEEYTRKRREERRKMKMERARKEREAIEEQLRREGKAPKEEPEMPSFNENMFQSPELERKDPLEDDMLSPKTAPAENGEIPTSPFRPRSKSVRFDVPEEKEESHRPRQSSVSHSIPPPSSPVEVVQPQEVTQQEHLQLALEEAFFLAYGLGALTITELGSKDLMSTRSLFQAFRQHSHYPPCGSSALRPDDPFLLKYVVYHHFRSLGWAVRPGVKFSVDYLLYNRGPVFAHAEFAVSIIPSYSHPYWSVDPVRKAEVERKSKPWWWLHCINRVQSHVLKTLVLVYVEVPPPMEVETKDGKEMDIGEILKRYKVREFVMKRWVLNRSRD